MPKRTEAPARVPGAMAPMHTDAALQSLPILQAVDNSTDVAEDAVELAQSVNVIVYALVGIPVYQGSGLAVIYTEALLDGLLVVVAAPALLAAQYEALHQLVLGNVELYHGSYLVAALSQHLLQGLGLGNGAGEPVEDNALVLLAKAIIYAGQDVYHQLIGYQLSLVDIVLGRLAKLGTVLDFIAENISSRDVLQAILGDHLVALGARA